MPGDAGQRCGSTGDGTVAQWLAERVVSLSKILTELLFVELANHMTLAEHLQLGFELCGRFSRSPDDPINGDVRMKDIPQATSVEKIRRFLNSCTDVHGVRKAKRTLELLADDAWSPTESVLATMIVMPFEEGGYQLGPVKLNVRYEAKGALRRAAAKEARLPDIMFEGTNVGINYDGGAHLDLESIADAAIETERNPGASSSCYAIENAMAAVRAKVVDDIRRNRELMADGLMVFPVVREDLSELGALDHVMQQVVAALAGDTGRDMGDAELILASEYSCKRRFHLIRSMMPGKDAPMPEGDITEVLIHF